MKKDQIITGVRSIVKEHAPFLEAEIHEFVVENILESLNEMHDPAQVETLIFDWIESGDSALSKDQVKAICARIFQDLLDYNLIFEIEEDDGDEEDEEDGLCKICERETVLTKHHVRPKEVHAKLIKREGFTKEFLLNDTVSICRPCHSAVHRAEPNEVLAEKYYTIELILTHPKVQAFIPYIQKQKTRTKAESLIGLRLHK